MIVARSEEQRLAALVGRAFARDGLGDGAVEGARVDLLVELGDLEVDLVLEVEQVDLPGARIDDIDLLALVEADPGLAERGGDPARRAMVDQLAVDHGLAVAVVKHRRAEDLARVQRRRRRQRDLGRVEIVEHAAVGGQIIVEIAEAEIVLAQLGVQRVAAMRLVDDDQVVSARCRPLASGSSKMRRIMAWTVATCTRSVASGNFRARSATGKT